MKQVLVSQGKAEVAEVPTPGVEAGAVLVRLDHSCISPGTEMSGVRASGRPLWKRALEQPAKVRQVARMALTQGLAKTRDAVQSRLGGRAAVGYSAAGTVIEVGPGVVDLSPGDRVACAGAQCAHHAEVVCVPRNLTVPVPKTVTLAQASMVTLGAIALQGVRRANPTLGESFVVLGLGLLGQLTAQILKANGCRVIGVDLDPARIATATSLGLDVGVGPDQAKAADQVERLTDGVGADGVIITAASNSDQVVSTAFNMCRRKGRVVLVGDVGLGLDRADFYQKEIDFFISTSYGPGRYDRRYEEEGLDYPVAYVRWTENRNMAEFLRLVGEGKVRLEPLIGGVHDIADAASAYTRLETEEARPLAILLRYPPDGQSARTLPNPKARSGRPGAVSLAVIGVGAFARSVHLPNLRDMPEEFSLAAVVGRSGHGVAEAARRFGAALASTDVGEILADRNITAVLIATRHDLHGDMTARALAQGKHVLVEKPLALDQAGLDVIRGFYDAAVAGESPILMTGYNRRFSPHAQRIAELVAGRSHPMILNYRMNAGFLPADHWVHGAEGGGRNLGEACHIYDLFTFLTESAVVRVEAQAIAGASGHYRRNDNFVATLSFEDGSVASLTYTAQGTPDHPKEQLTVYSDGMVITMEDYRSLKVAGRRARGLTTPAADKGHKQELAAFAKGIASGVFPIPLWQQLQAAEIALAVEGQI